MKMFAFGFWMWLLGMAQVVLCISGYMTYGAVMGGFASATLLMSIGK